MSTPALGPTQLPIQCLAWALSPGVKRPKRGTEVKIYVNYSLTHLHGMVINLELVRCYLFTFTTE